MFKVGEKVPHVHAEVIKAWADGAKIQIRHRVNETWVDCPEPSFSVDFKYRVKPEPTPDRVNEGFCFMTASGTLILRATYITDDTSRHGGKVRFTFDGETGKLKAVEII